MPDSQDGLVGVVQITPTEIAFSPDVPQPSWCLWPCVVSRVEHAQRHHEPSSLGFLLPGPAKGKEVTDRGAEAFLSLLMTEVVEDAHLRSVFGTAANLKSAQFGSDVFQSAVVGVTVSAAHEPGRDPGCLGVGVPARRLVRCDGEVGLAGEPVRGS